jgi:hypothetical protein
VKQKRLQNKILKVKQITHNKDKKTKHNILNKITNIQVIIELNRAYKEIKKEFHELNQLILVKSKYND